MLNAAIFFDLRLICGDEGLAEKLRAHLRERAAATPRFLRQMAQEAVSTRPPLGILSDFVTEESGKGAAMLDLKKSAARLFVDAARVIALASGVTHSGTAERLRQGGAKQGVNADETAALVEAFYFIQLLRLRRQTSVGMDADRAGDNHIDPESLNEIDRRMLKESLRQARKLQSRLALDYQL